MTVLPIPMLISPSPRSSYLSDVQGSVSPEGKSLRSTRPIMCNSDYEGNMPIRYLRHGSQPEDYAAIRDMPQLQ
eukprot:gene19222-24570_t